MQKALISRPARRSARSCIASALLVLIAAGCATQQQESADGVTVVTDPNHIIRGTHWEVIALPGEDTVLAAVAGVNPFDLLNIGCDVKDRSLIISLLTKSAPESKALATTLAYDAGAPVDPHWADMGTSEGIHSVGSVFEDPGFRETILDLKRHQRVEAMLQQDGKEVVHESFTLDGAPAAIDHVLAACGKSISS